MNFKTNCFSRPSRYFIIIFLCFSFLTNLSAQLGIGIVLKDKGHNPSFDPDGELLLKVFEDAAEYWENVFPDVTKYRKINVYWAGESSGGTIAGTRRPSGSILGGLFAKNLWRVRVFTSDSAGDSFKYLLGGSEKGNCEFRMQSHVYFNSLKFALGSMYGTAEDYLEIGYLADTVSERIDLYSVALHEIGHTLGLGNKKKREVKRDGYYSITTVLPGTGSGGIGVYTNIDESSGLDHNQGHIILPISNFSNYISADRKLPTSLDALIIAQLNDWESVNFPRQYMSGDGILGWFVEANWFTSIPGPTNSVIIADDSIEEVRLDADVEVLCTRIGKSVILHTLDHTLFSNGCFEILDNSNLILDAGGKVSADTFVMDGGNYIEIMAGSILTSTYGIGLRDFDTLRLMGIGGSSSLGLARINTPFGAITTGCDASIEIVNAEIWADTINTNFGTDITGGNSTVQGLDFFVNSGIITAQNGDLEFHAKSATALFDIDGDLGSIDTCVSAYDGSILFKSNITDQVNKLMVIGENKQIRVEGYINIADEGVVELKGQNSQFMVIDFFLDVDGGTLISRNLGTKVIAESQIRNGGSILVESTLDELSLIGEASFYNTIVEGEGRLFQLGHLHIHESSVINVRSYIWDGDPDIGAIGPATTTIYSGSEFIINSTSIGSGYSGEVIVMEGAILNVTEDWLLYGDIILEGGIIKGGKLTTGSTGTISGWGTIECSELDHAGTIIESPAGIKVDPLTIYTDSGGIWK